MDDKYFISGEYGNPSVFNNPEDSDIILICGTKRFYAHRAILRLWSPFFARSLNSRFPVAKSAIFKIDEDEHAKHEPFCAVLKHIYGMPFADHPENQNDKYEKCHTSLEYSIRVYMAADKYDVPSARLAAVTIVGDYLPIGEPDCSHVPEWIANICGPEAPRLADGALRNALFRFVIDSWDLIIEDLDFAGKIEDGSLFDAELNVKLLFELGKKIKRLNAKSQTTFGGRR
ncbi:hypothetical protein KCU89_g14379, partial [Aureobasidium melanogenum]